MPLPSLVGNQKKVIALHKRRVSVVLGTAGSGKTSMAIYRAARLSDTRNDYGGTTLLVTFNKQLVAYIRSLISDKPELRIKIETYHSFARGYLKSQGLMKFDAICSTRLRERIIKRAIAELDEQDSNIISGLEVGDVLNELEWVDRQGISSQEEYLTPLQQRLACDSETATNLAAIFLRIRSEYRRIRFEEYRRTCDWIDISSLACNVFRDDRGNRMYRHVVIDEGQDFSPEMIRSLALAVPSNGTLTFFGDAAQQIYGSKVSWRDAGLDFDEKEIWWFAENYRNTPEIARLAIAISQMSYFKDVADLVEPVSPTANGAPPVLLHFETEDAELAWVAKYAERLSHLQTVAIFLRRRNQEDALVRLLNADAIRLDNSNNRWSSAPGIRYGTYHSAKGLEFDAVIMPMLSEKRWPSVSDDSYLGHDSLGNEGRLLYVGVTRAKSTVVMTCTGTPTGLLPQATDVYREAFL